jgi:DnaK suppressor protein
LGYDNLIGIRINRSYIQDQYSQFKVTEKEKQDIKKRVHEEIEKTLKSVEDYKEMTKPISPENAIGRISRIDAINNKGLTEAALRQAENKLKSLNQVLDSLHEKDFGICLKCKKPISIGRILLMPKSRYCVNFAH